MKITIMVLAVLTAFALSMLALSHAEAQPVSDAGTTAPAAKADAPAAEPTGLAAALQDLKNLRAEWKAYKDRKKDGGSGEGTSGALIGLLLAGFAVLSTWGKTARRWLNREK